MSDYERSREASAIVDAVMALAERARAVGLLLEWSLEKADEVETEHD